jgi:hypothetical protein
LVNGESYDFIVDIAIPQLELGAFATSPILTTGAAATRLADVASITGTNFSSFWNQTEGAIVQGVRYASVGTPSVNQVTLDVSDGTTNDRFTIRRSSASGNTLAEGFDGGVSQFSIGGGALAAGSNHKVALAFAANDFAFCANGGAVGTDASGSLPTVDRLILGAITGSTQFINGHLQSLTYYAKRLPNATIQSLTV